MQKEIENKLALQMLEYKFKDGDSIIIDFDEKEDKFVFKKSELSLAKTLG